MSLVTLVLGNFLQVAVVVTGVCIFSAASLWAVLRGIEHVEEGRLRRGFTILIPCLIVIGTAVSTAGDLVQ